MTVYAVRTADTDVTGSRTAHDVRIVSERSATKAYIQISNGKIRSSDTSGGEGIETDITEITLESNGNSRIVNLDDGYDETVVMRDLELPYGETRDVNVTAGSSRTAQVSSDGKIRLVRPLAKETVDDLTGTEAEKVQHLRQRLHLTNGSSADRAMVSYQDTQDRLVVAARYKGPADRNAAKAAFHKREDGADKRGGFAIVPSTTRDDLVSVVSEKTSASSTSTAGLRGRHAAHNLGALMCSRSTRMSSIMTSASKWSLSRVRTRRSCSASRSRRQRHRTQKRRRDCGTGRRRIPDTDSG